MSNRRRPASRPEPAPVTVPWAEPCPECSTRTASAQVLQDDQRADLHCEDCGHRWSRAL